MSDATYIMGDGETPSFAEAMALQKAKQAALEEAGTYVQSYTRSVNQDLTKDEIQTLAGGVLQVEVLEKTRTLIAEGLRVYTKIKATVTTDKMEELARRIKGKDVTSEYTKLQAEYARLNRELEDWKHRAATTPQGRERDAALDNIREGAKALAHIQQQEGAFFQRLVSGKQLVESASRDKDIVDGLLKTIAANGFIVKVGDIKAGGVDGREDILVVNVPLTLRASEALYGAVSNAAHALEGIVRSDVKVRLPDDLRDSQSLRIGMENQSKAIVTLVRLGRYLETARSFQEKVMALVVMVTFEGTTMPDPENQSTASGPSKWNGVEPFHCYLGGQSSWEGRDSVAMFLSGYSDDDWYPLRRMFPVAEVFRDPQLYDEPRIDNGWYDRVRACDKTPIGKTCRLMLREPPVVKNATQDVPSRDGYVAIVRDEATFVATHQLHAKIVKEITGISARVVPRDQVPRYSTRCDIVQ